jgi:hypothetical protein
MPMYDVAVMVGSGVLLALGLWVLVRQRSLRFGGRVQDVPDAPPTATPIEEPPGLTLPYSSVDWTAPSKRLRNEPPGDGSKAE